jgi:hypothetical protein
VHSTHSSHQGKDTIMKAKKTGTTRLTVTLGVALALAGATLAAAPAPSLPERVAALKTSLAESKARLKGYEWVETTVVLLKGEEKSRTQQRCYHGADGKVQKLPVAPPPEPEKKRGIRGRIAEKKKEELSDYMKEAIGLVHRYLPPDPEAIQKSKDAGNASIAVVDPGKRVRLEFKDYLMPGDRIALEVTLADNRLAALAVWTIVDKKDPVTLGIRMGTLEDGATYAAETTLVAKAKDLRVVVSNSGYRKRDK